MGLLDRFRRDTGVEVAPVAPVTLDTALRSRQLLVLSSALDDLANAMRRDETQRLNPGWAGRITEYADAADRARTLRRDGFDLEALHDLAAEVRPLFVRGQGIEPPAAMVALEPLQDELMKALADLRTVRDSERGG